MGIRGFFRRIVLIWLLCVLTVSCSLPNKPDLGGVALTSEAPVTGSADASGSDWCIISVFAFDSDQALLTASQDGIRKAAIRNERYKISDTDPSEIEYIDAFGAVKTAPDGTLRIGAEGSKPVYADLLRQCRLDAVSAYFSENEVSGLPDEVTVISVMGYPLVLRVRCEDEMRFVTVNEESGSTEADPERGYSLTVRSKDEFLEQTRAQEVSVVLNGELLSGCEALCYGEYLKIPVLSVLKKIDPRFDFYQQDDHFVLQLDRSYFVYPEEHRISLPREDRNIITVPPGCIGKCEVQEEELYVDEAAFGDILRLINGSVIFERQSLTLSITHS